MTEFDVDVVVVGAGPAGATAATVLARAGHSVILLERGPFPGSKNMYGGVIYPRILDQLHPQWWEEAPVQRWITRRSTMVLTDDQAVSVDFRSQKWGNAPYNGATAFRPDWDHWLATKAEDDGATLVCSTTATGLLRENGQVVGVTTDRPDGDLRARVVIACDGVNSFLAKEAGMYGEVDAANYTVGVKETIALPQRGHRRTLRRPRPGRMDIEVPRRHIWGQRWRVRLHQSRHARRRGVCSSCQTRRAGNCDLKRSSSGSSSTLASPRSSKAAR